MATFMDKLLFLLLLVSIAAGFFFVKEFFPSGNLVRVSLNNRTVYILPISENRVVSVKGPLGENIVEIKDGKVRMKDAPCPEKLCVKEGWIESGSIICLPNRVSITISGSDNNEEYDAVSK